MEKIWLNIIGRKSNPLVWPALCLLWVVSLGYGLGVRLHKSVSREKIRTRAPVISIGNLTVGGTGKTPIVIEVARHFLFKGKKVGIVSSGYGRKSKAAVAGMGKELLRLTAEEIGDEMLMAAEILPSAYISVAPRKSEAAAVLDTKYSPDIILVDDGFQHHRLHRDLNILVIDARSDPRREALFPLGRRREPLAAIKRADLFILSRPDLNENRLSLPNWLKRNFPGKLIVPIEFINCEINSPSERIPFRNIAEKRIYFFAGIGSFEAVLESLRKCGARLAGSRRFPDHCRYAKNELDLLKRDIENYRPDFLVTTYKDYVKLKHMDFGGPLYYLGLKLQFDTEGEKFFREIERFVI
ncbi:putative Tetraacyldisaccharide 4'-kinase [Candidatus Zixiibacteriota bacterium]|nr:putative Tetraacyldisaccharide 4'-kinase [candidate division Zixibacteria bacterium]